MVFITSLYIYLCALCGNSPTGQTRRLIFAHDGSNDADSREDVPFFGFVDTAPHLGVKSPKTPNFGDVNRRFQAKLVKPRNMHIMKTNYCIDSNQILHSDKDHQIPFVIRRR